MCHRFGVRANPEDIAIALHPGLLTYLNTPFWAESDLYPLSTVPVIRLNAESEWEMVPMQWGLLPFWWKPGKGSRSGFQRKTFNARSETAHEKPTFRAAFKSRRCLIPATTFFEGTRDHAAYFCLEETEVMALAGLWETWSSDGEQIESCTILTIVANDLVAEYHPRRRMPVILPTHESRQLWMSPDLVDREPLTELFVPLESSQMSHEAIGQE